MFAMGSKVVLDWSVLADSSFTKYDCIETDHSSGTIWFLNIVNM